MSTSHWLSGTAVGAATLVPRNRKPETVKELAPAAAVISAGVLDSAGLAVPSATPALRQVVLAFGLGATTMPTGNVSVNAIWSCGPVLFGLVVDENVSFNNTGAPPFALLGVNDFTTWIPNGNVPNDAVTGNGLL